MVQFVAQYPAASTIPPLSAWPCHTPAGTRRRILGGEESEEKEKDGVEDEEEALLTAYNE